MVGFNKLIRCNFGKNNVQFCLINELNNTNTLVDFHHLLSFVLSSSNKREDFPIQMKALIQNKYVTLSNGVFFIFYFHLSLNYFLMKTYLSTLYTSVTNGSESSIQQLQQHSGHKIKPYTHAVTTNAQHTSIITSSAKGTSHCKQIFNTGNGF